MKFLRFIFVVLPAAALVALTCMGAAITAPTASRCIVVDNSDPGFTASSNWLSSTGATDKYGPDYRYRLTAPVNDPATWVAPVTLNGTYQISVWYPAGTNRTPTAAYILPNGATVAKNQQINGGQWNTLATLSLVNSNGQVTLSCWGQTGYVVVADAVRYCKVN